MTRSYQSSDPPAESERARRFTLALLVNFAQAVSFSLFLHFPGFVTELGGSETQVGFLMALAAASAVVSSPYCGRFTDRNGRRGVILAGNLLNVVCVILYLLVDRLGPGLYALKAAHGVAEAMLYSSLFAYAADRVPRERAAQGLALFGVSSMIAISAGGALGDLLEPRGGYRAIFLTSLAFAVTGALLSLSLSESKRRFAQRMEKPRGVRPILLDRNLAPLFMSAFAFFFAMAGIFAFMKTYVMATGAGTVGGFFAVYTLTAILLRILLGWLPDRLGLERVAGPALLSFALGIALLGTARSDAGVWAAALLCGVGHGFGFPTLLALVTRRAREAERGAAMAIYTAIDEGAMLVAGPVLGLAIEVAGYPAAFLGAAFFLCAAVAFFYLWDLKR